LHCFDTNSQSYNGQNTKQCAKYFQTGVGLLSLVIFVLVYSIKVIENHQFYISDSSSSPESFALVLHAPHSTSFSMNLKKYIKNGNGFFACQKKKKEKVLVKPLFSLFCFFH